MKKNYFFFSFLLALLVVSTSVRADVIDVSTSITNNDFTGDVAAWTIGFAGYASVPQGDGVCEAYGTNNDKHWFNCYQNITVPAGVYRLSAGALHRGYLADKTNVVLYATTSQKEYSTSVKSLQADATTYGSSPSSKVTAKAAFNAGSWINTVDMIVVEDDGSGNGTLRVGIRNVAQLIRATTATSGDIWTVWSNFKLYKLTTSDLDGLRDNVVSQAQALLAEVTDYSDGGALLGAITTLWGMADADLTIAAIKTLETQMATYRSARMSSGTISKPVDVTHLINNPSFELGQDLVLGTANGHYNQPKGWTLTYNVAATDKNNNITVINNKVVPAGVPAGVVINPTNGNYSFESRFRWTTNESMSITQTVADLPAGKYKLSADLGKLSVNGTSVFKGMLGTTAVLNATAAFTAGPAFTSVNATFDALEGEDLVLSAIMTQVGGEATIILDNIKLEYLGNEPFISANQSTLAFTPSVSQKVVNIKAGNISNDITLTPSASFELSTYSISAATAMTTSGVDVTVTCNGTSEISNGTLTLTSGTVSSVVNLTLNETPITVSHAGFFFDQSFTPTATFTVSGDMFGDIDFVAPSGISLSQDKVTKADALVGKSITLTWDLSTRVLDKNVEITSGSKSASLLVFAVKDNIISSWDGDNAEGEGSKLTDFGWSHTLADGITAGTASFQNYGAGGVRYVTAASAVHTYRSKPWVGHRVAYLRTWGNPATNAYNLLVNLEANETYVFRGVSAWHNNETNPTFTYSVNTQKANTGTSLGTQSVLCTVKQRGEDYGFEFTPTTTGAHYLVVTSDAKDDAMCAPEYLAIYPKVDPTTGVVKNNQSAFNVFPTITSGNIQVDMGERSGQIKVYNVAGSVVLVKSAASAIVTISLPDAGVYFVEVSSDNITNTVKVVKTK